MENKSTFIKTALPVFAISLINGGISSVNAVIQDMADALNVSLSLARMVSTLPSVIVMIVSTIVGTLIERKLSYKKTCLAGIIMFLIGGVSPIFVNSFGQLLLCRCIFGIGLGCFGILNSLYIRTFGNEKSAAMIGYGWSILSIGSIVMKLSAGYLGEINWKYAFIPYSLGFVTLCLFLLFFKEPKYNVAPDNKSEFQNGKVKWTPRLAVYVVLQLSSSVFIYPVLTGMSTFLAYNNIGGATLTGTLGSLYTLAGMFTSSAAAGLNKKLKKHMLPIMHCFVAAIGMAVIILAKDAVLMYIGCFLCGVANYAIIPTLTSYISYEADDSTIPFMTSFTWAINNLGLFVSSYWIVLADKIFAFYNSSDAGRSYLGGIVIYVIMGILLCIFDVRPKKLIRQDK